MPIINCKIGKNVKIPYPKLVNLYQCEIGNNSFVGPFTEIQKGVKIGKNVRIQSHTFIPSGVTIESNVFIGHGVMFINDLMPKVGNKNYELKCTKIERGVSIGSNATILPVIIGYGALIGAGAVVTKNVFPGDVMVGNPARILRKRIK